jgi:hypothetical protein
MASVRKTCRRRVRGRAIPKIAQIETPSKTGARVGLKSPRELRAAAATDTIDYAPVDTPLPASAACATDPAVTAAVPNAIWRNIVIAASYLDVT